MVEYGGGIREGPAGQVGGGGGAPGGSNPFDQSVDLFDSVGGFFNDAVNTLQTLSPVELVGLIAVVFIGLIVLKRAF
jgi:hypothetical protein